MQEWLSKRGLGILRLMQKGLRASDREAKPVWIHFWGELHLELNEGQKRLETCALPQSR